MTQPTPTPSPSPAKHTEGPFEARFNEVKDFYEVWRGSEYWGGPYVRKLHATNQAALLNAAYADGFAAAAPELLEALERIKKQCEQVREAPAFPMLAINARLDSIKVIARAALAKATKGGGEK